MCYTRRMSENYPTQYQFCPMCGTAYSTPNDALFEYVCHHCGYRVFENLIATGSGLIMRNDHQEILLVERAVDPQKGLWDTPGGFSDPNEHPQATAQRELQEELGVKIEIEKLWGIYAPTPYKFQNHVQHNCDIFYLAHIIEGEPRPADDVASFQWFSLNNLPNEKEIAFPSIQKALQELKETFLHA